MPPKNDDRPILVVPINNYSDGDQSHRPPAHYTNFDNDEGYLEKLATLWMEHRGEKKAQFRYHLDHLPAGYAVYGRPRNSNPKHVDKWCFGHPQHKWFDSPNRYFPHFLHLMENGTNAGCPCAVCSGLKGTQATHSRNGSTASGSPKTPSGLGLTSASMTFKPRGRPTLTESARVDEDGNPDVYRELIDKLKRFGSLDAPITEPMSMDWRAEKQLLKESMKLISQQPPWIPRIGELVLFVRRLYQNEQITYGPDKKLFMVLDTAGNSFKQPRWEAGVITQVAEEPPSLSELTNTPKNKKYDVNYSGFRVEPLPDPNGKDKSVSRRHVYVHLHHIRPFCFFNEYLKGVVGQEWDKTIGSAIYSMSTVSLVDKFRFKGTWPSAGIFCQGIYIGSELIVVGDVVRLLPYGGDEGNPKKQVTDVMKITSIKYILTSLDKASDNDNDEGRPYNSAIHIVGKVFTSKPNRAYISPDIQQPLQVTDTPEPILQYGTWYYRHDPTKAMELPFTQILTRQVDYDAMSAWFPDQSLLSKGMDGTMQARAFSAANLNKIPEGKSWFWADHRIEALDLDSMNGVSVAAHDDSRDTKRWRKEIKVLEGTAGEEDLNAVKHRAGLEKGLRRESLLGSGMVMSAIGNLESDVGSEAVGSGVESGTASGSKKRSRSVASLDGEEEEERGEERKNQLGAGAADVEMTDAGVFKALAPSDEEIEDDDDGAELLQIFPSSK